MRTLSLALALLCVSLTLAHGAPAPKAKPAPRGPLGNWCDLKGCRPATCADVRWAVDNLPQAVLDYYRGKATPGQIAAGKACLEGR